MKEAAYIQVTPYELATRFIGLKEYPGAVANPQILAMLNLEGSLAIDDSTPWCSAFASYVCWLLQVERSHSLAARSWLSIGREINLTTAKLGFDIVILKQNSADPGPEVEQFRGHVGFYAGHAQDFVAVLGGNQGNAVSIAQFPRKNILSVRRIRAL